MFFGQECLVALLALAPEAERARIEEFLRQPNTALQEQILRALARPEPLAVVAQRPWLQHALAPLVLRGHSLSPPFCALAQKQEDLERACASATLQFEMEKGRSRQQAEKLPPSRSLRWDALGTSENLQYLGWVAGTGLLLLLIGGLVPAARRIASGLAGAGSSFFIACSRCSESLR